jgi:hypothetical protein
MFVSGRRMFVPGPAVLVSSLSMLLRLLVLAKIVVVGGLVMMMSGSVVISGGLMMVLTGRMLGGLCHIEFPPQPIRENALPVGVTMMRSLPRHYCDEPRPCTYKPGGVM